MPLCPAAVVVAKPGRVGWALEEAWDLAVLLDGEARETGYPGVILVYSNLPRHEIVEKFRRALRQSFIVRIVVPRVCGTVDSPPRVKPPVERARLIVALRGASKRVPVEEIIVGRLVRDRRSRYIVDVEGVDEIIMVSWGEARACGYDCTLVGVE